jgi:tripartite-type tricarboxylate transporter receptor subunit TctC
MAAPFGGTGVVIAFGVARGHAMKLTRRRFLQLVASAAALPAVSRVARAQAYPARQVRWIVGYPAGGGTDIFIRLLAQSLSEQLGQQFVIENRGGAASNIGTEAVVRVPADAISCLGPTRPPPSMRRFTKMRSS